MKTRTLNAKLPMKISVEMDDKGQLNPQYMVEFVSKYLDAPISSKSLEEEKIFTFTYNFKAPIELHRLVKLKSIEYDISMGELLGRLVLLHY